MHKRVCAALAAMMVFGSAQAAQWSFDVLDASGADVGELTLTDESATLVVDGVTQFVIPAGSTADSDYWLGANDAGVYFDFDRTTSTDYWSGSYSVETNSVLHNAYDVSLDWYTLSPSGSASAVPEPAAALLMLAGAGLLATQRRKAAARA